MAESLETEAGTLKDSEELPDVICQPCQELEGHIREASSYCQNCCEHLCSECCSFHRRARSYRDHIVVKDDHVANVLKVDQVSVSDVEYCHQHVGEPLVTFCRSHQQLCCVVCQAIGHQICDLAQISDMAAEFNFTREYEQLNSELDVLKKGYNENKVEMEDNVRKVEQSYARASSGVENLHEAYIQLEKQTNLEKTKIKEEDLEKMQTITNTRDLMVKQINKIAAKLNSKQGVNENTQSMFIHAIQARNQLLPLQETLERVAGSNVIREYSFEPNRQFDALIKSMKVLGQMSVKGNKTGVQRAAVHVTDIEFKCNIAGIVSICENLIAITGRNKNVMLMHTTHKCIISELFLPSSACHITKVKNDQLAVNQYMEQIIQFISVKSRALSKGKVLKVGGCCMALVYNSNDNTMIVSFDMPSNIQIISLTGKVLKTFRGQFVFPQFVALSPDKKEIYVTDFCHESVTTLTMEGVVTAKHEGDHFKSVLGICVPSTGVVYVVGSLGSVYQFVPGSDRFKPFLDKTDGLTNPTGMTFCELENRLYIVNNRNALRVFQL